MKTERPKALRRTESGYATVAIFALVLLAIALLFANARTLGALKGELHLLETRQEMRLENRVAKGYTNSVPADVSLP